VPEGAALLVGGAATTPALPLPVGAATEAVGAAEPFGAAEAVADAVPFGAEAGAEAEGAEPAGFADPVGCCATAIAATPNDNPRTPNV
jgi:hypothetical protein